MPRVFGAGSPHHPVRGATRRTGRDNPRFNRQNQSHHARASAARGTAAIACGTRQKTPDAYQAVIDYFKGRLTFLQVGELGHWHPKLRGVVDLIGKTSTRDFVQLMYHAAGVLCPVTFAMHLAAAVPTKPGRPKSRPCVVVAGRREPTHWEAYPHHQFLSTVGILSCCAEGDAGVRDANW